MSRVNSEIRPGNPRCLHCVVNYAIGSWAKQQAPRDGDGMIVIDISEVIAKLAEVAGEFVYKSQDRVEREAFERYCHECLEAAFESRRSGNAVAVSLNDPGTGH